MSDKLKELRNSPEFAEEKLVAEVQSLLEQTLSDRGMSRTDLANRMGVNKSRVSQLFSDNQNFTVRLLARAFHALGEKLKVATEGEWEVKSDNPTASYIPSADIGIDWWPEHILPSEFEANFDHEVGLRLCLNEQRWDEQRQHTLIPLLESYYNHPKRVSGEPRKKSGRSGTDESTATQKSWSQYGSNITAINQRAATS